MVSSGRKKRGGFTLVETIVSSVILCGSVLAIGAASTRALSYTRLNRQYEVAASLADRQLTMIDYFGIDSFIESGQMQGEFDQIGPGYYWKVVTEEDEIDGLYKVNVTVSWVKYNRTYSVSLDTKLNGTGELIETQSN